LAEYIFALLPRANPTSVKLNLRAISQANEVGINIEIRIGILHLTAFTAISELILPVKNTALSSRFTEFM
jgi:hypothetical protein